MQQPSKVDNSEGDTRYPFAFPFDISPSSNPAPVEMASMFSGPSSLPHSGPVVTFVQRTHPSLNMYKANHTAIPRSDTSTQQQDISPPSPHRIQRRRYSPPSDGDEEGLDGPLPEDATEQEKVNFRRRQNTLAARKSRKRKQEQMQQLQDDVHRLSKEKDVWRERALLMKQLLMSHGLPSPNFEC